MRLAAHRVHCTWWYILHGLHIDISFSFSCSLHNSLNALVSRKIDKLLLEFMSFTMRIRVNLRCIKDFKVGGLHVERNSNRSMKICQRSVLINLDEAYIEIQKFIYNFITVHPIYGCGEMRLSALESDKYSNTNNPSRFILLDIFLFDCSKVYTIPETPSSLPLCCIEHNERRIYSILNTMRANKCI